MSSRSYSSAASNVGRFKSTVPRSFLSAPKSATPSAFSSSFSRVTQSKPANDSLMLPLDCAFACPSVDSLSIDRYFIAVGDNVGFSNIIFGGKNGSKIVMHLSSKEILDKLTTEHEFIEIESHKLPMRRLIDPGIILYLHNVVPHIPNDVIEVELKKHIHLLSSLELSNFGMRDTRLSHILAYKRQVSISIDDKAKIPIFIIVTYDNVPYKIHLSFNTPRCFNCGKEGHMAKSCESSISHSVQECLEIAKSSASSDPLPRNDAPLLYPVDPLPSHPPVATPIISSSVSDSQSSTSTESSSGQSVSPLIPFPTDEEMLDLELIKSCGDKSQEVDPSQSEFVSNDLLPSFATSISPNSKGKDDFPAVLKRPLEIVSQEKVLEKKVKKSPSPKLLEKDIDEDFRNIVEKTLTETKENSFTTTDFCTMLLKVGNASRPTTHLKKSGFNMRATLDVMEIVHDSPEVSPTLKSCLSRLIPKVRVLKLAEDENDGDEEEETDI